MRLNAKNAFTRKGVIAAAFIFAMQLAAYLPPLFIRLPYGPFDMTLPVDLAIPFVPIMIVPYILVFIEWIYFYMLGSAMERARFERLLGTSALGFFAALLFFVFLPTTYTRPEISEGGAFGWAVSAIYGIDEASRCFPSIHCFVSTVCFLLVTGRREIAPGLRALALAAAIVTYAATVLVKQHVFIDVPAGVALALICWFASAKMKLGVRLGSIYDKLAARPGAGGERKA